ncbi:Hypothetical predicted protein [Lecanosticta acicola]|uniref:Uncharacterized protein n=1 Tax=Lecanosticta acicola TaxID=111012 RepID=A0AAI8Z5J4_9PEZI|nr:Hypothetical predicted protein [Lecanosticta acicola]
MELSSSSGNSNPRRRHSMHQRRRLSPPPTAEWKVNKADGNGGGRSISMPPGPGPEPKPKPKPESGARKQQHQGLTEPSLPVPRLPSQRLERPRLPQAPPLEKGRQRGRPQLPTPGSPESASQIPWQNQQPNTHSTSSAVKTEASTAAKENDDEERDDSEEDPGSWPIRGEQPVLQNGHQRGHQSNTKKPISLPQSQDNFTSAQRISTDQDLQESSVLGHHLPSLRKRLGRLQGETDRRRTESGDTGRAKPPTPSTAKPPVISRKLKKLGVRFVWSIAIVVALLAISLGIVLGAPLQSALFDKHKPPTPPIYRTTGDVPCLNTTIAHRYAWEQSTTELAAQVSRLTSAIEAIAGEPKTRTSEDGPEDSSEASASALLLAEFARGSVLGRVQHLSEIVLRDWPARVCSSTSEKICFPFGGEDTGSRLGEEKSRLTFQVEQLGAMPNHPGRDWMERAHAYLVGVALYWREWAQFDAGILSRRYPSRYPILYPAFTESIVHATNRIIISYPPIRWSRRLVEVLDEQGALLNGTITSSSSHSWSSSSRLLRVPVTVDRIQSLRGEARYIFQLAQASLRLSNGEDNDENRLRGVIEAAESMVEWCDSAGQRLEAWSEGWQWAFLGNESRVSLYEMLADDERSRSTEEMVWTSWAAGREERRELMAWMDQVEGVVWAGVDALDS